MASTANKTLSQLTVGERFRLDHGGPVFESRGGGWYARAGGYDGGPWRRYDDCPVICDVPEAFALSNEPPATKPTKFDNAERTHQRKLIDGLDCLPGQQDLF